jgi:ribosome biogenesis GTPase A
MVVGIPNSGKSTLINMLAGRASAKTADKPGVTRSKQWIKLEGGIDLLDTPGVLWPKFENEQVALNLAFTGAIKDEITNTEEISELLLRWILTNYTGYLAARYKIAESDFRLIIERLIDCEGNADCTGKIDYPSHADAAQHSYILLEAVARKRGFLISGGEANLNRAAAVVLDEFRSAKIGRITIEKPM